MSWRSINLTWLALRWPREVEVSQLEAVIRLLASSAGSPVILEATGSAGGVEHRLALPTGRAALISEQLRAALPGLGLAEVDSNTRDYRLTRAIKLSVTTRRRALRSDDPEPVSRAILTALTHVNRGELLILQWLLGPRLAPVVVPSRMPGQHAESWSQALLQAAWQGSTPPDSEARSSLRSKQGEPGWRAVGRIAVAAASEPRQRQLLGQVLGALRATEAPGVRIRARNESPTRIQQATRPWRWPLALNIHEVLTVSSWPVGATADLPVWRSLSRTLPPSRAIPAKGRTIGVATWPGAERNVALSADDSLRHLHVLGPTGVGKSTLLLNLIVQDLATGRGVVVIEPKGDLIRAVLERIPDRRLNDVVLLDPTDEDRPVGVNPLSAAGRSPELVADQVLAVFHRLYAAYWGPRTQDILHASLLTLARCPGMTLVALPLLLGDANFRRRLVSTINDPIALGPFWAGFEAWSDAERTTAVAPVMNKLRPFILRPQLRRVIGQATPSFDIRLVFAQRKVLLVNLSKGQLGPEAAALLGSLVIAQLWQATQERTRIAVDRRHPAMVFIDEFQDYLHLPTDLSEALAEARGLGVGLTLAHQHLHQLEPSMRSAVLANARSRVCFQLAAEDARAMTAGGKVLVPEDFQSLGRFQAYAQLVADGAVQPWVSLRTTPPVPAVSVPAQVRAASRQRYGTPRLEIEAELQRLVYGGRRPSTDDLSPRRRPNGDRS